MLKKLLIGSVLISTLNAVNVEVKKADVLVNINTQEVLLKKGEVKNLQEGTTICYMDGKGKLTFKELKKQLKKKGRCLMIPLNKSASKNYLADMKHKFEIAYLDSSESISHGTGTKGQTIFKKSGKLLVKAKDSELIIYSKEFGPLPVSIVLKNKNGKKLMHFENDESDITFIRIAKRFLKTGMVVEVYNGFEEQLMQRQIILKEK